MTKLRHGPFHGWDSAGVQSVQIALLLRIQSNQNMSNSGLVVTFFQITLYVKFDLNKDLLRGVGGKWYDSCRKHPCGEISVVLLIDGRRT